MVRIDAGRVTFDAMEETLRRTTIGAIAEGRHVHVERSAMAGDEIGGHSLAGHVMGTAEIVDVRDHENNRAVTFRVPVAWLSCIFHKGNSVPRRAAPSRAAASSRPAATDSHAPRRSSMEPPPDLRGQVVPGLERLTWTPDTGRASSELILYELTLTPKDNRMMARIEQVSRPRVHLFELPGIHHFA